MPYHDEQGTMFLPRIYAYMRDDTIKIANQDNNWDTISVLEAEGLVHDLTVCIRAARGTVSPVHRRVLAAAGK